MGVKLSWNKLLTDLDFADDTVMSSESHTNVQSTTEKIEREGKPLGLQPNVKKKKHMKTQQTNEKVGSEW
jgi:hypothetical protein